MSDVATQPTPNRPVRRQRSIYKVHYAIPSPREEMATPLAMPTDPTHVQAYALQVAGHMKTQDQKYLGVLKCNDGTILKPIIKESQKREVEFYERLSSSTLAGLRELRSLCPRYHGCRRYTYNGHEMEYIVLDHLAERMREPCIMDVKIGKRTWDPLATEEKILNEQKKYAACKQQYGFCIPGYQTHGVAGGRVTRQGKDAGKRLRGEGVVHAIRNFLNGVGAPLCRALLLQFLSELWRIQRWARRQTDVKLYASSLLLVYDAAKLRECCQEDDSVPHPLPPRPRAHSLHSLPPSSFSGQLSPSGPIYKKLTPVPLTPMTLAQSSFSPPKPITSPWTEALEKSNQNHSFEHNYEDKLAKIKMNYKATLDQLSEETPNNNPWGTVKIIDFAHAFFNEEDDETVDENFKEGIDNFVSIFEAFLRETDDQVFLL